MLLLDLISIELRLSMFVDVYRIPKRHFSTHVQEELLTLGLFKQELK